MSFLAQTFEQALTHHRAGDLRQAESLYRQLLQIDPGHADALHLLGVIAHQVGNNNLAVEYIRQALRLFPEFPEAASNLGMILMELRKPAEAEACYRHVLRLKPDDAAAGNNLGHSLQEQGKFEEAAVNYRQALRLQPDYAEANYNLGNTLARLGQFEEAIAFFRQALGFKPDLAEAHNSLGFALLEQGHLEEAIASFQHALRIKPDYGEAYYNLGNARKEQGKLEEAIASYQQALRLKPGLGGAFNNLGNALTDQGRISEALAIYRQAHALDPGSTLVHSNLVFVPNYHPDFDAAALLQEARRWNDLQAEPLARFRQPHTNNRDPERRLRVGYVSPDFRKHALAYVLAPLLTNHDHRQVEVFCYAEVARPDEMTRRLRGCADVWHSTVRLTDEQTADLVRRDQIDILVDLALHTNKNRLLVFARNPAPVQVTWLGYPGTTGLTAIDYRLTDPFLDPPGEHDSRYSEQSIRLPDTFWCYDPHIEAPVNELPALSNGFITFGCLSNFYKVNDGVLRLWAKVLAAVPRSRLLLLAPEGTVRDHVLDIMRQGGIDEPRVEFLDRQPRDRYFLLYHRIDLALDLLPYNGHTTSLDGFWMGVPTLTLIGKTVVGRAGYSQLCNLRLPELAARTPEEFVANAVRLAGNLSGLKELRAGLRQRMSASPLMDGPRFARNVEQVYRQIWRKWCEG
jgi:predicted O-linked N-acetylglucosamine transferase (SPINDLY family)